MSALYTRYDVENVLKIKHLDKWYEKWLDIDVYFDEIVIHVPSDLTETELELSAKHLKQIFGSNYSSEQNLIKLDYLARVLKVNYETTEDAYSKKSVPLFKEMKKGYYKMEPLAGVPIVAFHSYKGGVGRTLSLIAAVRSLSMQRKSNGTPFRLLIVDGDIEAPGLTWLAKDIRALSEISFLDSLAIIHEEEDWRKNALPFIANKIKETVLKLPVAGQEVEHYFLPSIKSAGDDSNFITPIPVTPENMVSISEREWIISDFLSELGKTLEVDAVFIDLRAGVTELAAPILFDERVRKIYVTSSSLQSRMGIKGLLKRIYPEPIKEDIYPNPLIFITMVTEELKEKVQDIIANEFMEIFADWAPQIEPEQMFDMFFRLLPFSSDLVYLEGFDTIDRKLAGTAMAKNVDSVISEWFIEEKEEQPKDINKSTRDEFLDKLINLARKMEFAESNKATDLLSTAPLKNLSRKYSNSIPISIILGAKGSGKTFIYFQLIRSRNWEKFIARIIDKENFSEPNTSIIPFLIPKNLAGVIDEVKEYVDILNQQLGFQINIDKLVNRDDLINSFESLSETEWKNFWRRTLLESLGKGFTSFDQLQLYLEENGKRIVFIIDGLEEIFQNISDSDNKKIAVRALCQGIINELYTIMNSRIGLIVFMRRDLAMNAIETNWGQFYAQYEAFELRWTHTEALRLTLWLASSINSQFKPSQIPIESATRDVLEKQLYPLWGLKLGKSDSKEANSANWILAALSDLNKQLQARDIIRFLKYAADGSKNLVATDRYLSPSAIRNAIDPCSQDKIEEIKQEINLLKDVFEKLQSKPSEERQVPFQLEDFSLTSAEAKMLEQQGFLIKLDDGYYMPEIIRRGLNFSLPRGARPKVFALLKRALKRGKD
ncbi:MAG: hypothetical protein K6U80_12305 [Firmicutes bacterium]|nr:hypothetical protein [Bacillota bacterium]